MLLKKTLLALLLSGCYIAGFSQSQNPNEFISIKNFTPPSPEAAALGKYGEIPTDISTGVPQISIPVYEIKSKKLSVPISFSYHASGIKLHDAATPVGLGWVLNAGGEISRNVVGKPDDFETGLLNIGTDATNTFKNKADLQYVLYNGNDYTYLDNMSKGYLDSQSDQYSYSSGDLSGKFVYDVNKTLHFTPIDRQPMITWNLDSSFTVIDDAGNRYLYRDKEYTTNQSASYRCITSWHISKIISADLTDSIEFYYFNASDFADSSESHSLTVNQDITCYANPDLEFVYSTNLSITVHERKLVDSISFVNGYVKFSYSNDREDIIPERLRKIIIGNQAGIIKETELIQSYFQSYDPLTGIDSSETKRLRLDSVKLNDRNSQPINNNYSFQYSDKKLPPYHTAPGYLDNETDYWGYYNANGSTGGPMKSTLPRHFGHQLYMYIAGVSYAVSNSVMEEYSERSSVKYANPEVMDACILQKITYPTGGYTLFEFEPNQISGNGDSTDYRGGLRVSKIISFDTANRTPIVKSYVYESVVSISPNIPRDFYYQTYSIMGPDAVASCGGDDFHIVSNPGGPIGYFNGSPVINQQVTEYDGFPGLNNGKTVYTYDCELDSIYSDPDTEKYWNFSTERNWGRGNLLNKKIYKYENDSSILIKEIKNYYDTLGIQTIKIGEVCERMFKYFGSYTSDFSAFIQDTANPSHTYFQRFLLNYYEYLDIVLPSGIKKLRKTEEIDYLDSSITKTQEIFYEGNNHLYPTKTFTYTSNSADTLIEITKYPQDKTSISGLTTPASDALDGMVTYNILTTPVETETYRNSQLLFRNRTDFKNWNNSNRFYEEYKKNQKGAASMEARIQYKTYNTAGNPTTLSQYYGSDITYIWGYNQAYSVAQVTNANDSMVAYTSFETFDSDPGTWNISGTRIMTNSVTGKSCIDITAGYVSRASLPTGKYYIVTYWSLNGSASVNGNTGTSKKTKNGWTLYEHMLSNSTTSVYINGSRTIDELRLYPEDAQMISYTYNPLVGITSSCSPNDLISYYEYDDFGRLKTIRDQDRNIVKTIDYKYNEEQGQSVVGWSSTGYNGTGQGLSSLLFSKQEKDFNSSSPTYNQTRYVAFGLGGNYPEWTYTGQWRCITNIDSITIGEEEEYKDTNPYSSKFGRIKWVSVNHGHCYWPPPPCTGPGAKIVNDICEIGVKVYTGAFYDSFTGIWTCIYHWRWSDDSTTDDLEEFSNDPCPEED